MTNSNAEETNSNAKEVISLHTRLTTERLLDRLTLFQQCKDILNLEAQQSSLQGTPGNPFSSTVNHGTNISYPAPGQDA